MEEILIREAEKKNVKDIIYVLDKAFNKNILSDRDIYEQKYKEIEEEIDRWIVLTIDEKIVGGARILKHWLKVGKSKILKGDVGEVSILPECQGKGYGHKLMEGTVEWMRRNNYDLSRLGGLYKFYSRFGYVRFPRRYMEIVVGKKVPAGASVVEEGEIPIDEEILKKVGNFLSETDKNICRTLRNKFVSRYNGSLVMSKEEDEVFGVPQLFFVFREDGRVVGYIGGARYEKEYSDFEGKITISDIAYRWDRPYILQCLVKYINNLAYKEGIDRITLRIPFDPVTIKALAEVPVNFKIVETYGGTTGNMLQVINMQSLFNRLVPELEARLKRTSMIGYTGTIKLAIEKDSIVLDIKKERIKVVKDKKADIQIELKEFYLLQLILGLLSFSEIELLNKKNLDRKERDLLNILFPRCPVFSGVWG